MLDMLGILVSGIALVYICIRAAILDRTIPWFEDPQTAPVKDQETNGR